MEDYSVYNKRFKSLLESKSGNVKPLLKESDMNFTDQPHFVDEDMDDEDYDEYEDDELWGEENESWDQDDESFGQEEIKF